MKVHEKEELIFTFLNEVKELKRQMMDEPKTLNKSFTQVAEFENIFKKQLDSIVTEEETPENRVTVLVDDNLYGEALSTALGILDFEFRKLLINNKTINEENFTETLDIIENQLITYFRGVYDKQIREEREKVRTECAEKLDKLQKELDKHVKWYAELKTRNDRLHEVNKMLEIDIKHLKDKDYTVGNYDAGEVDRMSDEIDFLRQLVMAHAGVKDYE